MNGVELTAPGKLLALCIVLVGCLAYVTAAMFVAVPIDTSPAWATIALVVGYLIGNGVGARRGVTTAPTFSPASPAEVEP